MRQSISDSVRTTLAVLSLSLLSPVLLSGQVAAGTPGSDPTVVVVVRHAEKATDHPTDPSLTAEGETRAEDLLAAVEGLNVSAMYVTQYKRTRDTGAAVARHFDLSPINRPTGDVDLPTYARQLADEILASHAGEAVVVVGHSGSTPAIVQALSGKAVDPITESEYDHIFTIVIPSSGPAQLLKARYGTPTWPEG